MTNQEKLFKMSNEELLLDMLEYYTADPVGRRCVDDGYCYYSPKSLNKETSEGCAIGRLLPPELALKIDEENPDGINADDLYELDIIPDELAVVLDGKRNFLSRLQVLHDKKEHWTHNGLYEHGKRWLAKIIQEYGFDRHKFSKYLN